MAQKKTVEIVVRLPQIESGASVKKTIQKTVSCECWFLPDPCLCIVLGKAGSGGAKDKDGPEASSARVSPEGAADSEKAKKDSCAIL